MTPIEKTTIQQMDDDEIDLRDLIRTLIKQKKIILLVAGLVICGAVLYALLVTPVYKAKVSFLPPTKGEVAPLRIPTTSADADADADAAMKIYADFEKNLNSMRLRREIFDKMNLLPIFEKNITDNTNKEAVFNEFNTKISIEKPAIKKGETVVIPIIHLALTGKDPQLLADILNQIEHFVRDTTKQEVIDGVLEQVEFKKEQLSREINELRAKAERQKQDEITRLTEVDQIERKKLEDQINALRMSAKTKRMDQIVTLTEAANVAESIGLIEKSSLLDNNALQNQDRNAFYTEVTTQAQPLYLRGSKALRSEIKELTERSSDDPFIPGLRDLQDKLEILKTNRQIEALLARESNDPFIEILRDKESELAVLNAFKIDPNRVSVATLDQAAFPPKKRESPKRSLIVALGVVGGLFLGIIAAFMVNFWQTLRLEDEGTA